MQSNMCLFNKLILIGIMLSFNSLACAMDEDHLIDKPFPDLLCAEILKVPQNNSIEERDDAIYVFHLNYLLMDNMDDLKGGYVLLSASNGQKFKTDMLHQRKNQPFLNFTTGEEDALRLQKHMLPVELTVSYISPQPSFSILRDMMVYDIKHTSFEDLKIWKSGEDHKFVCTLDDLFSISGKQTISTITINYL